MDAPIDISDLVCYKQVQKSLLNVSNRTCFTTKIAMILSVKENARIKFWFSALLFPKGVLKVVHYVHKQARSCLKYAEIFKVKLQSLRIKRFSLYHGCGVSNIKNLACVSSPRF